ncbi:hypothetical protein [Undibacterium sp. TC9W]|uniref:hypothetical protein n=1 Tax=Undibacterium sp. TC9W TaxID=3413053 RepID=UPI003BF41937
MIVAKHRILQTYAITYAPGKAKATRYQEVAKTLGIDAETVAAIVAESIGAI